MSDFSYGGLNFTAFHASTWPLYIIWSRGSCTDMAVYTLSCDSDQLTSVDENDSPRSECPHCGGPVVLPSLSPRPVLIIHGARHCMLLPFRNGHVCNERLLGASQFWRVNLFVGLTFLARLDYVEICHSSVLMVLHCCRRHISYCTIV